MTECFQLMTYFKNVFTKCLKINYNFNGGVEQNVLMNNKNKLSHLSHSKALVLTKKCGSIVPLKHSGKGFTQLYIYSLFSCIIIIFGLNVKNLAVTISP